VDQLERRTFMKGAAVSALAFTVGGAEVLLTAREARAQDVPLKVLTSDECAALEALGDTLLPGAKDAGIAHYVDQQLGVAPADCMLVLRTMDVAPPYVNFYRGGLAGLDQASLKLHGAKFAALTPDQRYAIVEQMQQKAPDGWTGPPPPFFYFITRVDAVDVYYGTVEGFERLGIPYMPHILPTRSW
jgi:hypothetical protein